MTDRTPPHDLGAERAILGAILLHGEVLNDVIDLLTTDDFYRDAHRRIYGAMLALNEDGSPVDFTTLRARLAAHGELEDVGGPVYISAMVDGLPKSTNITAYADIVRERSAQRRAIQVGQALVEAAYDGNETATDLAALATERLLQLSADSGHHGRPVHVGDLATAGLEALERAHQNQGQPSGVATGFSDLDAMTMGLQAGELTLLAARPAVGKTSWAMNVARHVARAETALVFSLEMSKEALYHRLLSSEARIDGQRMRGGYLGDRDWGKLSEAIGALAASHLHIDDTPGLGVMEVRAKAKSVQQAHGLSLVVVDYIQLMRGRGRFDSRQQEIGTVSRGLKAVSKELRVPVLACAQLGRSAETRKGKKPELADLRESGDLENDADVVLMLHRPEVEAGSSDESTTEVLVRKQRNGPTGSIKLAYTKECTRFDNLALGY